MEKVILSEVMEMIVHYDYAPRPGKDDRLMVEGRLMRKGRH